MKKTTSTINDMQDAFPVIRLGYNKKLKNCNATALPLLNEWHWRQGNQVPSTILQAYPEIEKAFKNPNPTECKMMFGDLQISFDLIPFPEAGYIGLYSYHIEAIVPETSIQKLKMAS